MTAQPQSSPLLSVRDLAVHFPIGGQAVVRAVDGVSFDLARGRTLAIVGESGSGKTTTALSVLRLADPTGGRIEFDGTDLTSLRGTALRRMRRRLQLVFQDPYSSLNPRQRAGDIVRAPLDLMGIDPPGGREARVALMFELVGLRADQRQLYPHQFSGGQRQRLNIARALASGPDLIVCDEPVSALDIAIRAQILNLLRRIQREQSQSFLFISHDMAVVEHVCDDIAVMYLGKIIERATRQAFFSRPLHPYSVALMSAVPTVKGGRDAAARRVRLTGDPPSPVNPPPGCRFAGRCPVAQPLCASQEPPLREAAPGHHVACHFVESRHGAAVSPLQA
ncbi:peptide ABC transporter ATP-binding protein [Streptomyces cavourensis]|jgi:peptide/nickel transport system ATP-binding protein|uniref:ABC transporter ATP-binding protein n=1 Tax=unclassified Achromobacter TaxID=2626865 RepID=UPI000DFC050A|nr:peptide ABC transporter ATP-binding protein [Streptomyces cavourensis]